MKVCVGFRWQLLPFSLYASISWLSIGYLWKTLGKRREQHSEMYVNGRVHTQGIENFWSLLKRGLTCTYVAVEPFHLHRYLDEQTFRYNNRKDMNDGQRFELAMSHVFGKRLTYSELTGKDESPRHETTGTRETEVPF